MTDISPRTGRGRGENTASLRRIKAAEKRRQALELRKAGATYDQIAERLGFSSKSRARESVIAALAELTLEPAREVLTLELERLDAMLLGLWRQARAGDLGTVDRVLKIMDRRAKYLGLDKVADSGTEEARSMIGALADGLQAAYHQLEGGGTHDDRTQP
ncbi:hypothetical protein GCM10012275_54630 [Longimycelium tulufanense]|uniref:Uncharacterized protein n=1 Tax=Longimycelium tulufanense TaxID=907463 RepID=A0A8J3CJN1_9PSEU|nr:hypothetical protein [Longimycelium tulufanense]GGM77075.1 hypothetical protein GCM10012275_54630 [Longimycelium tulufanense]